MIEQNKKRVSRLRPIQPELAEYIRLANVLPAPHALSGVKKDVSLPLREPRWEYSFQVLADKYPDFKEFLGEAALKEEGMAKAIQQCGKLKTIRSVLYTIARHHAGQPLIGSIPVGALEDLVSAQTDSKGILRVLYDPFLRALEGAEVARIRECARCGVIYWAGRLDKLACNECTRALRQKRYRENYPLKYKVRRYEKAEEESRNQLPTRTKK